MDERESLARRFEENRTHLRAVAYRMLGSIGEADDAVQEAWLRLSHSDTSGVQNLGGWLTTVVSRVCLDVLRSRRSRRGAPLGELPGARVPDPVVGRPDGIDPEHEALLADGVGLALLVVLESLAPAEPRTPPGAGSGHFCRRRSCLPAGGRRRLLRRLARGRFRGAARGARPGRGAANRRWCLACGLIEGGPRRAGGGRADVHLLAALPVRATGPRERGRGGRRGSAWPAVCGHGLHGQAWEDRRDRRPRRPRAPPPARLGGPRRLTLGASTARCATP